MTEPRRTLLHEWFDEVWNKGRAEAIDELFAEDGVAHGLVDAAGNELVGPAGYRPFFEAFKTAFPNLRVDVVDTICEGDKIVARCEVRGTHTGNALGMIASNRPVLFTGIAIVRVADGKIAEAWNNFDFQALHAQTSAQPSDRDFLAPSSFERG